MLTDGRRGSNRPTALPPDFARSDAAVRRRRAVRPGRRCARSGRGRRTGRGQHSGGSPSRRGRPSADRSGRDRGARAGDRPSDGAAGSVADESRRSWRRRQVGVVAVPPNPPPVSVALRELGPTLAWFGLGCSASARRHGAADLPPDAQPAAHARAGRTRARRGAHRRAGDRNAAATKSARWRGRSTGWRRISTAARRRSANPIAPGVSCWPTSRTS